ncbi:MAG TPA: tetratricopeptide repeat protein [Bryobacteraceae bacterium]|nr:tetratricopeptide repeat protein [Bryobacteraceae bacterium]
MIPLLVLLLAAPAQERDAHGWLVRAQQYYQQQEWSESEAAARKALALDPRLGGAEVLLGWIATNAADLPRAEEHFAKAVALAPRDPRAIGYLASTHLALKRVDEAASGFEQVLRLDPGNATALYNLGAIALLRARPDQALPRFRDVLRSRPQDAAALTGALESELLLHQSEEARRSAAALEAVLGPKDLRLLQAAALLGEHGEHVAAIGILARMRAALPESYETAYNLALAYYRAGRYEPAAGCLRQWLEPARKAEPWNLLGAIEEKRGRGVEALAAYRKAAQLEPGNEDYRLDAASHALQQESVEAALAAFTGCVRDFPASWRMHLGLGAVEYLAGDYDAAARVLLETVAMNPDAAAGFFLLGKAYESAPAWQPRILDALRGYTQGHRDPWAEYHVGTILMARAQQTGPSGRTQARAHIERALALRPDFAEAQVALAALEDEAGRPEQARRLLARAVELDPRLAAAHYKLGLLYQRNGQADLARNELRLFQELKAESKTRDRNAILHSLPR